jgi:hypothetical protein
MIIHRYFGPFYLFFDTAQFPRFPKISLYRWDDIVDRSHTIAFSLKKNAWDQPFFELGVTRKIINDERHHQR